MPEEEPLDEIVVGLGRLLEQAQDAANPAPSRIVAVVQARAYLEALTRRLVNEARETGSTWEELAVIFGTSPVNAKARYGDYNDYD